MSIFLSQKFLVPAWFLTIGVVAFSTPPPSMRMAAFLLVVGVVIVPAVVFALGSWWRPMVASPARVQRPSRGTLPRSRAAADADARDLGRMDSDKG